MFVGYAVEGVLEKRKVETDADIDEVDVAMRSARRIIDNFSLDS